MKTPYRIKIFIRAICAFSFITYGNICSGIDHQFILVLNKQVDRNEGLWKAGNIKDYYRVSANLSSDIITSSKTSNVSNIAAKLLEKLISKEDKIHEISTDMDDLSAMQKLGSYLLSKSDASIDERRINAQLLSRYLGKVRKEIVPNYKQKPVYANIAPPLDVPGRPGMNPNGIHDPVARTNYEAAIQENHKNIVMNSRQMELVSIERRMSKPIIRYIIETFRGNDASSPLLAECIKAAMLNDKEKEDESIGGE